GIFRGSRWRPEVPARGDVPDHQVALLHREGEMAPSPTLRHVFHACPELETALSLLPRETGEEQAVRAERPATVVRRQRREEAQLSPTDREAPVRVDAHLPPLLQAPAVADRLSYARGVQRLIRHGRHLLERFQS